MSEYFPKRKSSGVDVKVELSNLQQKQILKTQI